RARNRSHSFEKSHEILLPMRADDAGRGAFLRLLRAELQREALPKAPRESPQRRGLFPMRQPGTLDAAAQGFRLVECPGVSRKDCLRGFPRLPVARRVPGTHQDSRVPELAHRLRRSYRLALVAVGLASGMVST